MNLKFPETFEFFEDKKKLSIIDLTVSLSLCIIEYLNFKGNTFCNAQTI